MEGFKSLLLTSKSLRKVEDFGVTLVLSSPIEGPEHFDGRGFDEKGVSDCELEEDRDFTKTMELLDKHVGS